MKYKWDEYYDNIQQYPEIAYKNNQSVYEKVKRIKRPRIDYLPQDIIKQIKILEEQFQKYQKQLMASQNFDIENEPKLEISSLTEAYIKVNNPALSSAERSGMMLQEAFGFQMQ